MSTQGFASRQRFARARRRITCDLYVDGEHHGAIVTDLSANGLYVRTSKLTDVGTSVRIVLHEESGEMEVDARVARWHRMSRHHTTGIPSGLGLQIVAAPETYFSMIANLLG